MKSKVFKYKFKWEFKLFFFNLICRQGVCEFKKKKVK